jgi:hypothetical protein
MTKFQITHSGHPALSFSNHWNNRAGATGKVHCKAFSTIRRYYAGQDKYQVGQSYEIIVKGTKADKLPDGIGHVAYGVADVVEVRVLKVHQLQDGVTYLDAGCDADAFRQILAGMYGYHDATPMDRRHKRVHVSEIGDMDIVRVVLRYSEDWHEAPKYYLADGRPVK